MSFGDRIFCTVMVLFVLLFAFVSFYGIKYEYNRRADCHAKHGVYVTREDVCIKAEVINQ